VIKSKKSRMQSLLWQSKDNSKMIGANERRRADKLWGNSPSSPTRADDYH